MPFNFEFGETMMFDLRKILKLLNGVLAALVLAVAMPAGQIMLLSFNRR